MDIKYRVPRHRRKFPHSDPLLVLGIALAQRPGAALFRKFRVLLELLAGDRRKGVIVLVLIIKAVRHGGDRGFNLVLRHFSRENGIDEAILEPNLLGAGV